MVSKRSTLTDKVLPVCSRADSDFCNDECSGVCAAVQMGLKCINPAKGGSE